MIGNLNSSAISPRAIFVLQGIGLILLTSVLLFIFTGGRGDQFLEAILVGIATVWLLKRPYWGVAIILTVWFVEVSPSLMGIKYLTVPYVVSALLMIPLVLSIFNDREIWVLKMPQVKILLAIGLLFFISTGWSAFKYPVTLVPEYDETTRQLQLFVTRVVFLIFFLYFVTTRRRITLAVWLFLGLIIAACLSALYPFLTGAGIDRARASFSLASNPNRLAFISLFATSLLWFYRSYARPARFKIFILPLIVVLPLLALASGSRSGLLQLVVLAAMILKEQEGWSPAKRVRSIFLVVSVSLLLMSIVPAAQFVRATSYDSQAIARGAESLRIRIHTIAATLEMTASDPIFGIGIGNFRWMHKAFYGSEVENHNSYLWALSNGGIVVLVLYLFLFYTTYRMLRQLERSGPPDLLWLSKGLRVGLILFLIFSAFADMWLNEFYYVIVGTTIAMTRLYQPQGRKPVPAPTRLQPVSA